MTYILPLYHSQLFQGSILNVNKQKKNLKKLQYNDGLFLQRTWGIMIPLCKL